jgi:hypothetical protein
VGTITVLRPSATSSGVGWSAVPGGTLHGVTSDDNDATYALWSGDGSPLILATPVDSPPAGERRHQVRLRARGEDGDAWWAVRLSSGALAAGASAQFSSSPSTVTGSWGFGAPPDGSTILYTYVTGQTTGVKINELYLDMDSREAPTFTPQVLDGSGTATTTISDTAQPVIRASAIDLDGLAARYYRYWVTLNGATVWDTGDVSGSAVNRQTDALDNGTYVAHLRIWTTLGRNFEYASDEETITFTVSVGTVPAPDNPAVDPGDGTPFYTIEACAPFVGDLDGDVGWVEIQRVDCPVGGYLSLTGSSNSHASTPDPGTVLTGLEITVVAGRDDDWRPAGDQELASHYDTGGDNRSWRLYLDSDGAGDPALIGRPVLGWSEDGIVNIAAARATDRPMIDPYGVVRLRVRLDTDDGAGGWAVTFETRDTDDSEWVLLGEPVTNSGAGTTSIFTNTGVVYAAGAVFSGGLITERFVGRIYSLEIRNGEGGPVVVNPDFTGHLDGTASFDDTSGATWTVHSPASIYSPVSTVSVAMLGPLATDECAEWTDFTLPRSGVGLTCDHAPVPCCSYYRARTVGRIDGDLRISAWSDAFNGGVAPGVIMMWPGTDASLPAGWSRVTALDGRYPKGVSTSVTEPGTTGGTATHTHTTPGHTHDLTHGHTVTGATGTAVGTQVSTAAGVTALAVLSSHTHTRSALASTAVSSISTAPSPGTANNDPARLEVIFAESNGSPLGLPDGSLAISPDTALSGWSDFADATSRFLKGAAAAGNGGATVASAIDSHTHSVPAHTHAGNSHTHTSPNTSTVASAQTLNSGASPVLWQASHSHAVSVGSSSTATLSSGGSGSSGAGPADGTPPYRNMRVQENVSGVPSLPVGLICAWRGSLGAIPDFWSLCDGTSGTPDLTALYPRGATAAIGTTGGSSNNHDHSTPSHAHSTSGHSHTTTVGSAAATPTNATSVSSITVSTATHTHSSTDSDSATPSVGSATSGTTSSTTTEPPFEEVAFIQLVEEPEPSPLPDTFCLSWSDDEHLIRTMGPDGPLWAAVLGKFEWDVTRPFTAASGVNGSRFVTSAEPGGRNLSMSAAVESEEELAQLREVLARPLVLISPSDASEVWAAPVSESVRIIKIGRIRQISATFIGTGPQPPPQLADVVV